MKVVMLYDGFCVLCQQTQKIVRLLDWFNRVERIDAQNTTLVYGRFPELQDEDILGEIFVQSRDGSWLVGFFGMREIAKQFPVGWLLLPILYFPGMNRIGPNIYRWIAKRRYNINKLLGNDCVDGVCKIAH